MIRPLKKENHRVVLLKFIFLLSLFVLPFLLNFKVKQVKAPDILGERVIKKNNLPEIKKKDNQKFSFSLEEIRKKAEEQTKKTGELIDEIVSESTQNLTNFVVEKTIINVIQEVNKLPKEQKEKIKEEICKQ